MALAQGQDGSSSQLFGLGKKKKGTSWQRGEDLLSVCQRRGKFTLYRFPTAFDPRDKGYFRRASDLTLQQRYRISKPYRGSQDNQRLGILTCCQPRVISQVAPKESGGPGHMMGGGHSKCRPFPFARGAGRDNPSQYIFSFVFFVERQATEESSLLSLFMPSQEVRGKLKHDQDDPKI